MEFHIFFFSFFSQPPVLAWTFNYFKKQINIEKMTHNVLFSELTQYTLVFDTMIMMEKTGKDYILTDID